MYRDTYAEINLGNIGYNVKTIINYYSNFKYYFGVVKADCYGHGAIKTTESIIKGGVNYLVVALLEEALELRKKYQEIPILCLGMIENKDIHIAVSNHITLSIISSIYLKSIDLSQLKNAKVHIKVNTGMNRLGVSTKEEFNEVYHHLIQNNIEIEGIYSHIHSSDCSELTRKQFEKFESITSDIDLSKIEVVHIQASDALIQYEKPKYVNGCRLGIIMYGFTSNVSLQLKSTFKLYSKVIQINCLHKGDTVGYNALYQALGEEKIAVIPIGYADGIIRKNTGSEVYIGDAPYPIVGNICMDMLFVKVDDTLKIGDKVILIQDKEHIMRIAKQLDTIVYEVLCSISKRVPRKYING